MAMTEILQAIGSVGFPIVACAAMFWLNNKMTEQHKQEMDKMTEAINNNTEAIKTLSFKIEKEAINNG